LEIKLMQPFMMGRYFQALAIYLSDSLKVREYGPDYIVVEDESYRDAIEELIEKVEERLEKVRVQLPLFGNDYKYFFKKILGKEWEELRKKEKEISTKLSKAKGEKAKELWAQRVEIWKEMWRKTIERLSTMSPQNQKDMPAHLQIIKASVHKYPKEFLGVGKDNVSKVEDPKGEALAIAGAVLSLLGKVGDLTLMLMPPLPESMKEIDEFRNSLRSRYEALEGIELNYPFEKLPCSSEVLLQFIFARAFKDKIMERIDCLNPVDNLFLASVGSGGNRAMVNSIIPIMASEIVCKLERGELLDSLLKQLWKEPDVAGACVNDLFQYVISSNVEHVYRCARRYSDMLASSEEVKSKTARKMIHELSRVIT